MVDTFGLTKSRPWHSYALNAPVAGGATDPYGNPLDSVAEGNHVIGMKQYELVNHLSNVQETVSDKKWSEDSDGDSTRDSYKAVPVMVYDYYPFGQLMPGRSLDTTGLCVTHTRYTEIPNAVRYATPALSNTQSNGGAVSIGGTSLSPLSSGGVNVTGTGGGLVYRITSITAQSIQVLPYFAFLSGTATVTVYTGMNTSGNTNQLGSTTVSYTSPVTPLWISVSGTATTPKTITVVITMGSGSNRSLFSMDSIGYQTVTYTVATGLYTQCGNPNDKYEFGFNGKYKDNEVAGVGNTYNFDARMYNSQIGRFFTRDPHANKYPGISPYVFVGNNPIIAIDRDGKDIYVVVGATNFLGRLFGGIRILWTPGALTPEGSSELVKDAFKGLECAYELDPEQLGLYINDHSNNVYISLTNRAIAGGAANDVHNPHIVIWNPRLAYKIKEGICAPFRLLTHELRHWWHRTIKHDPYPKQSEEDRKKYDNPEEQKTTEEENEVNRKAREKGIDPKSPDRKDHGSGKKRPVKDPCSTD